MYAGKPLLEKAAKFLRLMGRRVAFPPGDISLEISTTCDASCGICFRNTLSVEPTLMSLEVFERLTARLREAYGPAGPAYVNFVGLGELLLNPDLLAILRHFKKTFPAARANISTNLRSFDPELFRRLLQEGLVSIISASLDDTEEPGPLYHSRCAAVAQNIRALARLKAELRAPATLRVLGVLISAGQALRLVDFAAGAGVDVVSFNRMTLHGFPPGQRPRRPSAGEEKAILRSARALAARLGVRLWNNDRFNLFMDLASRWDKYCLISDDHLYIDSRGRVRPCFCLLGLIWGSLLDTPLKDLYAAKPDFYAAQPAVCGGCDVYMKNHRH